MHRQRRAQRASARLAVDLDRVVARLGPEGDAAAVAVRRRQRAGAARPVPFWRQALAPSSRPRRGSCVDAVPRRRAFSSARAASWTRPVELLAEDRSRRGRPCRSCRCREPWLRPCQASAPDLDDGALRGPAPSRARAAGSRPAITSTISSPRWVTRLLPIWPGPRMPLNTRDGVADAPIEPGRAHVVRAVADRAAAEVVALDRALEALALRGAGDLDALALLEDVDRQLLADLELLAASSRNSRRWRSGGCAGLLEMAELRPWSACSRRRRRSRAARRRSRRAPACADRGDAAGAGLDHGDALDDAVLDEELRHPELSSRADAGSQTSWIWMSTPAGRWSSRCSESTVFGVG